MPQENKLYQLNILFSPLLEQNKVEENIEKIKQKITAENGSFSGERSLSRKRLAYPIKKHQEAFCYALNFLLSPELVNRIEKYLSSEANILRYLLAIKKTPKTKPAREPIDLKMIDKIEPLEKFPAPREKPAPKKERKEKVKIEELDKKLKEILGG